MAVTAIDPARQGATPVPSDFERLRDHRICGARPLGENGLDAVHSRLSEAYALLAVIGSSLSEPDQDGFDTLNSDLQGYAISGVQRLIAEADFEAERMHVSARGGARV